MVHLPSVVIIALVSAVQDGMLGARLNPYRSLSAHHPVKRPRHGRGKNTTMHSNMLNIQNKAGQKQDNHIAVNAVDVADSPHKVKYDSSLKDIGQGEQLNSKTESPISTDIKEKPAPSKTCESSVCQVTPYCSYNQTEMGCSCAEGGQNETEAIVNCTVFDLAAIFEVFHDDATVTSVCLETQFAPHYELDCHIKGVAGLTYLILVEGAPGREDNVPEASEDNKLENLNACMLQLYLQSQEVLGEDDWMDSTLKTAITTAGIVISVFMIIFIFYSCKAL